MDKFRKGPQIFYLYYFVVFFGTAIQSSFLMMYLSGAGMSQSTVGIVNGVAYLISFAVYPVYGRLADRASSKNKVLIAGLVLSVLLLVLFSVVKSVFLLGVVTVVFTVAHNPLVGIYEAIAVEHAHKNSWSYGPIRMSGTIGYAIMALLSGWIIGKSERLIFPIYIFSMVLATTIACFLPKSRAVPIAKKSGKEKTGVFALLKVPKIRNVLILYMIYTLTATFRQTYYGIYMIELGGSYALVGVANMIMAFSEIPFYMGPGRRWIDRMGIEKTMLMITLVGAVRWLIVGVCQSPGLLVFTMVFNGVMLVPTVVGVVEFLHRNAPAHLKASAQTTLRAPFQVGGQLLGTVAGGWMVGLLNGAGLPGIRIAFIVLSPLSAIALIMLGKSMIRTRE